MRHVHGIAFQVLGEAFAALPTVQEKVARDVWSKLNFENLPVIDVTGRLGQCE